MKLFRADLHIHTTLSPCGDLDMHPARIVTRAAAMGLDIIGITDHNTTRHCELASKLAAEKGITVLLGAEVTTKEEVHCLVFFESTDALNIFQDYLDANLPWIMNDPAIFGHQVQCDGDERIVYEEPRLLLSALGRSLTEVTVEVRKLQGLVIPAHVDKMKNSIYSQLGFLPAGLDADALEVSARTDPEAFRIAHRETGSFSIISSGDAHYPDQIGSATTLFELGKPSFGEIAMALRRQNGRRVARG